MSPFTHHIFVCCNQRAPGHTRGCCDPDGSQRLREAFKREIDRQGLKAEVRANSAGCLEQCELGPAVVIYPQAIWYGHVTPDDVPRIVERTILRGETIEDLHIPDQMLNTKGKGPAKPA
ncbi:MAG TPA: (2Fe-2S) ferredoxin domain-containing protein [Pirellulaceae bacterium]|jgi:(2Fe-2S) ferredoxin|nr:(2Fe-2S) ferredoxin domain-containing protein [Pirellulaceae bacterium]